MARIYKTRHQLFLPEELSKRLAHVAKMSGKARSAILVEALAVWFERRQAPASDEAVRVRLLRIERTLDRRHSHEILVWELLARLVRLQLVTSAQTPPSQAAQAIGSKLFAEFIDEAADRIHGRDFESSSDPAMKKLRSILQR